jgi:serine/threonine protein kinase
VLTPEDPATLASLPKVFERLQRITHPNAVRLREHGWLAGAEFVPISDAPGPPDDARFYYSRDWIEGTILRNHIDNRAVEASDFGEVLGIIEAVGLGVGALHRHGVLHLGLTPTNVILPRDGSPPRVIGLDNCCLLSEEFRGLGSRGSPGYTAPELFAEGADGYEMSPASDVYSLAVLLHEMVAGQPPFGTGLAYLGYWSELTRRAEPFRLPMQFEGGWADGLLAALLRWSLEGMPRRRPQSVAEFLGSIRLLRRALT